MTKQEREMKDLERQMRIYAKQKLEQFKTTVEEQELSARSWKAYYEKMYFTIESQKIKAEYEQVQAKLQAEADAERQKNIEAVKAEVEAPLDEAEATEELPASTEVTGFGDV